MFYAVHVCTEIGIHIVCISTQDIYFSTHMITVKECVSTSHCIEVQILTTLDILVTLGFSCRTKAST